MLHGCSHVTHLYSAMSTLRRRGAYRHLGLVECAYLFDALTVEVIADGKHLPPELLRLIVRQKGVDSISLITDAMRGADLPDGTVARLGSLELGQDAVVRDGVAFAMDGLLLCRQRLHGRPLRRTMWRQVGRTAARRGAHDDAEPGARAPPVAPQGGAGRRAGRRFVRV